MAYMLQWRYTRILTIDFSLISSFFLFFQSPLELKKKLEEVRLLESRRSARLADQDRDTDFARLADMANDRRRQSHNIDVPFSQLTQNGWVTFFSTEIFFIDFS